MGVKCQYCGTDNGITHYFGKVCKRCGKELGKVKITSKDSNNPVIQKEYNK